MPKDTRLGGRVRTRINAQVRARNLPCPLCGYPVDQTANRTGRAHPLSSVIDEWFPRSKGGNPHDPANTVELHRLCNAIKSDAWPITPELQQRCHREVTALLTPDTIPTAPW